MSGACSLNCLGSGTCLYAATDVYTSSFLLSSNTTSASATHPFKGTLPECGCVCSSGRSSAGSHYTDPESMSANCFINSDITDVLKVAVLVTGVLSFIYAAKSVITHKMTSTSAKKIKGLALHVRSLCFHLDVFIFMVILLALKNEDASKI